jgi:hypothetical protein
MRAKQIGGLAEEIEHLLCKDEVLSSNLNPTKKSSKTKITLSLKG